MLKQMPYGQIRRKSIGYSTPDPDKSEIKIFATKALRHKEYIYFVLKNLILYARSEIDGSAVEFCV